MASDSATKLVNGSYGNQQQYPAAEQHLSSQGVTNTTAAGAYGGENANPTGTTNNSSSAASEGSGGVPKDEVGWYFVEQYYTTLSKSPEKLHLFYSKRSQFVSGVEAEKVSVSVGQRAINERIKELDIQDCKVRVSNVDSQESFKNIVVQVIGEMSNKAAPHRKFVQTFVLAEQPNGYFVLNDIFRYINEDEEEEIGNEAAPEDEAAPVSAPDPESSTLTSANDPAQQQHDIEHVDKKLEEQIRETPSIDEGAAPVSADVNGSTVQEPVEANNTEEADTTPGKVEDEESEMPQDSAEAATGVAELQPEKPMEPDPTPVASPLKPVDSTPAQAQTPVAPPKPAAPKTWANLVAANPVGAPVVPNPAASTSPNPSQNKATPSSANRSITPPTSSSDDAAGRPQQNGNAGWQTAGTDSNKRQGRQQSMSGSPEKDNVLGYVKNVTEKVDASLLKSALLQYGKLVYFDVSRQKNCAFVEFADPAGYNAAVAANPHSIGGEQIYVEERRPRPTAYGGGFGGRGGMRGGRGSNDGRPGSQGRGNYLKDGGRGGFVPRGRGGSMTPRGRGQPQAA